MLYFFFFIIDKFYIAILNRYQSDIAKIKSRGISSIFAENRIKGSELTFEQLGVDIAKLTPGAR
jgi:hypothetical protein